jgi:hypothetical protein
MGNAPPHALRYELNRWRSHGADFSLLMFIEDIYQIFAS